MTQMKPQPALSLFDLIGRNWDCGGKVQALTFNDSEDAVLVLMEDGKLHFLQVEDQESTEQRMRMDLESGRMTIRPREKPLPIPVQSKAGLVNGDVAGAVAPIGTHGFAFVHASGSEIWRATAKGQTLRLSPKREEKITGFAYDRQGDRLIVAFGQVLAILQIGADTYDAGPQLSHEIRKISVSTDGENIVCWGPEAFTLLSAQNLAPVTTIECDTDDRVNTFAWSPDGRWLVAGSAEKALVLIDLHAQKADRIVDFPASVRTVDFSTKANALIASGGFRVVGWTLPELPFGEHCGEAIETGKPGLTVVEAIAAHPTKELCATGYANGLVTVSQIGTREEMMLREGGQGSVSCLAWSRDGTYLAIGTADGQAAIVTIPKSMFK